ncbi:hypothetical protein DFS34DRAFT_715780 [Phlyctochytrium arcticum]|nr:hypothetical protein DFS34DRAFT_715780 [Phlyctochytrium arcticum]
MEYRIKGGKMPHLDAPLMQRLLEALLQNMGHVTGNLLRSRPTIDADIAFVLFGEFLEEVFEFRDAVAQKSATDLRHHLKLHRHCQSYSTDEERQDAAGVLALLLRHFPQHTWQDLCKQDEHDHVERLMKDFKEKFDRPTMPPAIDVYPPQALYFDKNVEALMQMYGTDPEKGLPSSKISEMMAYYGPNKLPSPPRESPWKMLWTQVTDFMVLILVAAAIAQFATDDAKAGIVLLVVVAMNIVIGFSQEYKANKALEALLSLSVPKASVIRDGRQETIDSEGLVPGDLVVLEEGDAIPADLRLVEIAQLEIVEVLLTGEALPIAKNIHTIRQRTRRLPLGDCKGNAFMTTTVARGRGKGLVVRTANATEIGKISTAITAAPKRKTNLQIKLDKLGKWLVAISILLCGLIIVIGVAYKRDAVDMVKIGVSLAVSVIPEGLVAVVTVTMALGVVRMSRQNAIVRKLPSVETLGSVNVICSDKTGTLTEGKMGTDQLWTSDNSLFTFTNSTDMDPNVGNARLVVSAPLADALATYSNASPKSKTTTDDVPKSPRPIDTTQATDIPKQLMSIPTHLFAANMAAVLCNNSNITYDMEEKAYVSTGDPTEVAMIQMGQKIGAAREMFHGNGLKKIGEYAFDSDRKLMSVVVQQGPVVETTPGISSFAEGTTFVFCKGAPENVLKNSTHYLPPAPTDSKTDAFKFAQTAQPEPVTDAFVDLISQKASDMASGGLRVLALAMRRVAPDVGASIINSKKESAAETDLTFLGLIGLIDPAKQGVQQSVTTCRRAGIKVVMITGDHVQTATAIAKQLGIMDPHKISESRAMKGYELDLLSESQLAALKPFPVVFARVSPDNKLKIVKALQSMGFSTAMTGDGVNDAPAIKQADVGVAMGISGTEITKQAADIVLANDNFSTIVEAVREGRGVFDNIQKFVVYLLSCNSAEIFLFLITTLANIDPPFTTILILWANIIADVPPAMSLGVEPHETDIMSRRPRPRTEGVLTIATSLLVLIQGLMLSGITIAVYMLARAKDLHGPTTLAYQRSLAFMTLTVMQLTQSFFSRSISHSIITTGVFGNKYLVGAYIFSMVAVILGMYIPGFNSWLGLVDIGGVGWGVIAVCLVVQGVVIEVVKLGYRRYLRHQLLKGRGEGTYTEMAEEVRV